MTELERKLHEHYFHTEIFPKETLEDDTNKIYKLVVMSRLYDVRIHEDLMLLRHVEEMYGASAVYSLLYDSYTGESLLAKEYDGGFGYNSSLKELQFRTYLSSNETTKKEVIIATDDLNPVVLDNLKVWTTDHFYFQTIKYFRYDADYILKFVIQYDDWSKKFRDVLQRNFM